MYSEMHTLKTIKIQQYKKLVQRSKVMNNVKNSRKEFSTCYNCKSTFEKTRLNIFLKYFKRLSYYLHFKAD